MTITFTVGSWIIPAAITAIVVMAVSATAYSERNDTGLMAGLGTALTVFCGILVTLTAWIAWGAVMIFK